MQEPSKKLAVIVLMISSGVALASKGELKFDLVGFITQAAAVAVCFSVFLTRFRGADDRAVVRGISSGHDPDSVARPEDGPPCLTSLLRASLCPHQLGYLAIH